MGIGSLGQLRSLAQRSPAEAEAFLGRVQQNLVAAGQPGAAAAVAKLLAETGDLVERLQAHAGELGALLPETPGDWGALQTARAATLGWVDTPPPKSQALQGTLGFDAEHRLQLTTAGGKVYALAQSSLEGTHAPGAQAFVGDGNVTLQGTLGADGKTFNVEDAALNTDGRFSRFLSGRVSPAPHGELVLSTPRGKVFVTNPKLVAMLAQAPGLYVLLPGEAKAVKGRLVYDQPPSELFALGRSTEKTGVEPISKLPPKTGSLAPVPSTAVAFGFIDMAHHHVEARPALIPEGMQDRFGSTARIYLRGTFVSDGKDRPRRFDATYVSRGFDGDAKVLPAQPEAPAVQAAVELAEG